MPALFRTLNAKNTIYITLLFTGGFLNAKCQNACKFNSKHFLLKRFWCVYATFQPNA